VRSADRVTAVLLFAFSVAFAAGALKYYSWWGSGGPGSAFLPFWLGLVMALLAVMMFFKKSKTPEEDWLPRGEGLRRMLVVLGVTVVFVALLRVLGMVLGTALFIAFLMRYLGRHRWWVIAAVAVGAAAFNYLVFVYWLRVPFPEGMLWIF
jgi:putative tricarboxylic transport membrane protein